MLGFILGFLTVILVFLSLFMVLVILMQRTGSGNGMGAAMGGGSVEAAFGSSTGNVLTRGTTYAAIAFFVLAFVLFLGTLYRSTPNQKMEAALPEISLTEMPAEGEVQPADTERDQEAQSEATEQ